MTADDPAGDVFVEAFVSREVVEVGAVHQMGWAIA